MDIPRAKYCSKIDLSNAYEQVWIELEDVWKTAFTTIYRTFISQVMQQGDCNDPATFQYLMTVMIFFLSQVFFLVSVVCCPYFRFTPLHEEMNSYLLTFLPCSDSFIVPL